MISSADAASPIIGLFTDYGVDDPYIAQVKGTIVSIDANARLLDLLHTLTVFDVSEGSYLLDQCAAEFPSGTIVVAVVDPGVGSDRDPVLLETGKGKFYVGPNNGLFTAVIDREGLAHAWRLDRPQFYRPGELSRTFHGRDIFAPIAAHLADGTPPDRLGTPIDTLVLLTKKEPVFAGGLISAQVLHVDRFGNVILNVAAGGDAASQLTEGSLVKISIGRESFSAPLVKTYSDVGKGRLLLLYGGAGQLEISVNQGFAAHQLKVAPGDSVILKP